MAEEVTTTRHTVTTGQPVPTNFPTTEETTTTTYTEATPEPAAPGAININAPMPADSTGVTINVPEIGGVPTTDTTAPGTTQVNINNG